MSVTTVPEFQEGTAFERFALDDAMRVLAGSGRQTFACDLRTNDFGAALADDVWAGRAAETIAKMRPLLVGAAWKVLDALVELALAQANLAPPGAFGTWPINQKVQRARARDGLCLPLSADADVWPRVLDTYAGFEEPRHCLVHRAFVVGPAAQLTQLRDRNGNPVADVTATEQDALCAVARRVAVAVIGGTLPARAREDLLFQLDQLARLHGQPGLGAPAARPVALLIADATRAPDGAWLVDADDLRTKGEGALPGRHFDVELHFPDSGHGPLRGEVEDMPTGPQSVDPAAPPLWLRA